MLLFWSQKHLCLSRCALRDCVPSILFTSTTERVQLAAEVDSARARQDTATSRRRTALHSVLEQLDSLERSACSPTRGYPGAASAATVAGGGVGSMGVGRSVTPLPDLSAILARAPASVRRVLSGSALLNGTPL